MSIEVVVRALVAALQGQAPLLPHAYKLTLAHRAQQPTAEGSADEMSTVGYVQGAGSAEEI